jgi:acyl carrier protein
VRTWLITSLAGRVPDFEEAISDETPLTAGGLCLDSLALTELIVEIEQGLGVDVRAADIVPEHFETVGRLLRFLEMKRLDVAG